VSHERVAIGVDDTDHVAFFCPECKGVMTVTNVDTNGVLRKVPAANACTNVYLKCTKCGNKDWRKFYWLAETGENCTHRTDEADLAEAFRKKPALKEFVPLTLFFANRTEAEAFKELILEAHPNLKAEALC
jgi:hypothetical protein